MKKVAFWGLLLLFSAGLTTLALYDNGKISLVWQGWVVETSVTFALAMLVVLFLGLYGLFYGIGLLWRLPRWWRNRRRMKAYARAETHASKGLIALEYGDWQTAETQLLKSAQYSDSGLVHYLSAAKMAHYQSAFKRRDHYLAKAKSLYPEDFVTIGLVEARLLLEQEPQKALSLLATLYDMAPRNRSVLVEYVQLLRQLSAWEKVEQLLPEVRRLKALSKADLAALELTLIAEKLKAAPDLASLQQIWQNLPKAMQLDPPVLAEYVEKSAAWGQEQELAYLIEKSIKKQWDDRLVHQYGRLQVSPAFDRLKVAEKWLKKQPENPILLLTLGRLACRSQLWGKGQDYLKQSLKLRPEVETFHALALCYEAEGAQEQAALTYKEAILQLEDQK